MLNINKCAPQNPEKDGWTWTCCKHFSFSVLTSPKTINPKYKKNETKQKKHCQLFLMRLILSTQYSTFTYLLVDLISHFVASSSSPLVWVNPEKKRTHSGAVLALYVVYHSISKKNIFPLTVKLSSYLSLLFSQISPVGWSGGRKVFHLHITCQTIQDLKKGSQ